MEKDILILVFIFFFTSLSLPVYAAGYTQVPQYLCEIGIEFYQQGNYAQALHEFNKALLASPDYPLALEYIEKIKQQQTGLPVREAVPETRTDLIRTQLDKIEREQEGLPPVSEVVSKEIAGKAVLPKKVQPIPTLILDETLKTILQPIDIELDKSIIIVGRNIRRFLVTQPDILIVEKKGPDELLVTAKNFGYTYLHIWDERQRWTVEFLGVPPKPEGPSYEEELRLAEERAGTFKLRYYMDWSSFETGRRLSSLRRSSYTYSHILNLNGETPYGKLGSSLSVRSLSTTTDLSYFSLWLTEGKYGPFNNFSLRAFDYSPGFSNLAFGGASLRGVMLESPAFHDKIDYKVFWGREGGGKYGGLSPGLTKIKDSFLSGLNLDWDVSQMQNYRFSVVHGWGRDRLNYLNPYGYDLNAKWNLDKFRFNYEVGYDSESFAHLWNVDYIIPKLVLNARLRDVSKKYLSSTGYGAYVGELGGLFGVSYAPTAKLSLSSRVDIFQDRLNPSPENDNRWNENFYWDATYAIDPLTSIRVDFNLDNQLGRVSQYRTYNEGLSLYKAFELIRKINTFLTYRHQESTYYTAHSSDSINNQISSGLRFSLLGDLYYYLNGELNWLEERYTGNNSRPRAMEMGVDWTGQILKSPFYASFRSTYRNEENTVSTMSLLSGEDSLEGYAELSYRPNPEKELYCSTRVRNVWADNPNVNKHIDADFRAGMRYAWDTGVRWESIGTVEGYVFKDFNSDGLRQRDEPPVDGVKVWLGKDKSLVTDILGYYKFTKVKARKAYINIDTTTIPAGFTLTVPQTQEVMMAHGQVIRVNFGIASRSEISGIIFEDTNADGQPGPKEPGIKGVVLILEDGSKVITDDSGRYSVRKISAGRHTLNLDLNSLPTEYIPAVPIFKDIELFEGVVYNYNIPLKKIKE